MCAKGTVLAGRQGLKCLCWIPKDILGDVGWSRAQSHLEPFLTFHRRPFAELLLVLKTAAGDG